MRLAALALAVALTAPMAAHAAMPTSAPSAEASRATIGLSDAFLAKLKAGKVAEAYRDAFKGSQVERNPENLEQLTRNTQATLTAYGAVVDWTLVEEAAVGSDVVIDRYLVRTGAAPLFFYMQYYRSPTGWRLINLSYSDNLDTAK